MKKYSLIFILALIFVIPISSTHATVDCLKITSNSPESDKNYCKNELTQIEAELSELVAKQKEQQKQTGTLKGDINYLNSQITALQAKIKARSLAIAQLKVSINEKVNKIESLEEKIAREHESLAEMLRKTNEIDNESLAYVILSKGTLSDFYTNLDYYFSIKDAIKKSVDLVRGVKNETEIEKKTLEQKQDAETDAKIDLEASKKKVSQSEAEKKQLLSISQQKESEYQKLAAEKRARAEKSKAHYLI